MKKLIYVSIFAFILLALTSCFDLNDITSITVKTAPESYVELGETIKADQFKVDIEAKGVAYTDKSITDTMLTVYGLVEKNGELVLDTSSVGKKTITVIYESASVKISYFVADALIKSWDDFEEKMPTQTGIAVLMNDINVETVNGIEIEKDLTFDLNGHTLTALLTKKSGSTMIRVINGTLTIQDSTDINRDGTGRGKLTFISYDTDLEHPIPQWANNTIEVRGGKLVLQSGTIENTSTGGATYCVDLSTHVARDSVFTMNGGRLINDHGDQAVRIQATSTSQWSKFVMTGGVIESGGFWLQYPGATNNPDPSTQRNKAAVEISGGVVNGLIDVVSYIAETNYIRITGNTVVNCTTLKFRSEGNNSTGKDNVQKTDVYFTVDCTSFTCTNGIDATSTNISNQEVLQKLISISTSTQVSSNLNFLVK